VGATRRGTETILNSKLCKYLDSYEIRATVSLSRCLVCLVCPDLSGSVPVLALGLAWSGLLCRLLLWVDNVTRVVVKNNSLLATDSTQRLRDSETQRLSDMEHQTGSKGVKRGPRGQTVLLS